MTAAGVSRTKGGDSESSSRIYKPTHAGGVGPIGGLDLRLGSVQARCARIGHEEVLGTVDLAHGAATRRAPRMSDDGHSPDDPPSVAIPDDDVDPGWPWSFLLLVAAFLKSGARAAKCGVQRTKAAKQQRRVVVERDKHELVARRRA